MSKLDFKFFLKVYIVNIKEAYFNYVINKISLNNLICVAARTYVNRHDQKLMLTNF